MERTQRNPNIEGAPIALGKIVLAPAWPLFSQFRAIDMAAVGSSTDVGIR